MPSFTAFAVVGLLEQHFARLVDYGFTASMEDDLDEIANGDGAVGRVAGRFYFGDDDASTAGPTDPHGLKAAGPRPAGRDRRPRGQLAAARRCRGRRAGRRPGRPLRPVRPEGRRPRASIPDDMPPDELTVERAMELLNKTSDERLLGQHPETGEPILCAAAATART